MPSGPQRGSISPPAFAPYDELRYAAMRHNSGAPDGGCTGCEPQPIREDATVLAYTYPLADLFGTMLGLFVFFIWFWLLIIVFSDIFRSHDLGGGAKMLWVLFVIILPFLG